MTFDCFYWKRIAMATSSEVNALELIKDEILQKVPFDMVKDRFSDIDDGREGMDFVPFQCLIQNDLETDQDVTRVTLLLCPHYDEWYPNLLQLKVIDIPTTDCRGDKCRSASVDKWCTGCSGDPPGWWARLPRLLKGKYVGYEDVVAAKVEKFFF